MKKPAKASIPEAALGIYHPHTSPVWRDILAWATLAVATLVVLWPLGLTNRILAGVDALTYFTPYWAYRMTELAAGRLPLWNPYLFLGVPFLANPQAAVLYPLHWPLSWLRPEQALVWSALIHVWLAAGFTYTFGRRSLRLSRGAAWLAGAIFAFGGFTLARIENINQLNALAWLPASLWLLDEAARAAGWRPGIRWIGALAGVLALQILAGHTQTLFINGMGVGLWAVWPIGKLGIGRLVSWCNGRLVRGIVSRTKTRTERPGIETSAGFAREQEKPAEVSIPEVDPSSSPISQPTTLPACQSTDLPIYQSAKLPIYLSAIILAVLLSAAQLLPTLELNGLGLRTGGLSYRQAVSFSLRPLLLARTLLPPFGGGLAEAFGSEGYAEFAGWVSVTGLLLAGVGAVSLWRAWRRPGSGGAEGRRGKGTHSTHYALRTTPYALLLLAAAGLFLALGAYNPVYYLLWHSVPGFDLFRAPARWLALYALGMAGLAGLGLDVLANVLRTRVTVSPCHPVTLSRLVYVFPILLVLAELALGARALPFAQATAPAALSLRNAPAAMLSAADQPAAGRDRFLSLSDIRYDPGDLLELRALQSDRLAPDAVERAVRAAKQMEVLAPNLSLLLRLPAVDGYDGGMLPLARYVKLQELFLPPDRLLPDGRLREQLRQIPDGRLLDLTGVRYVITDKQRDVWSQDVYYDLEQASTLQAGQALTLSLAGYPPFSATAIGLAAEIGPNVPPGTPVGSLTIAAEPGQAASPTFPLRAGVEVALAVPDRAAAPVQLTLPGPSTPTLVVVRAAADAPAPLVLRGITLIDRRTGAHQALTVSPRDDFRRIHSGDVKVYERLDALGRAWLVHGVQGAADDAQAFAAVADPSFDPRTSVVIVGDIPARPPAAALPAERVTTITWEAERIVLRTEVAAPAWLVLADSFYPGWSAQVDGAPQPILQANTLFRAVALAPGTHEITFAYRPTSWRLGAALSLLTLIALGAAVVGSARFPLLRPGQV